MCISIPASRKKPGRRHGRSHGQWEEGILGPVPGKRTIAIVQRPGGQVLAFTDEQAGMDGELYGELEDCLAIYSSDTRAGTQARWSLLAHTPAMTGDPRCIHVGELAGGNLLLVDTVNRTGLCSHNADSCLSRMAGISFENGFY